MTLVVFSLEGKDVVFLAEFLLFEGDVKCSDISFKRSFLDSMLVFELFEGDLDIFS